MMMEFEDFKETCKEEYAVFSGERIVFWDSDHVQHFFIKKTMFPIIMKDSHYQINIFEDKIKVIDRDDNKKYFCFELSLPLLIKAVETWKEVNHGNEN